MVNTVLSRFFIFIFTLVLEKIKPDFIKSHHEKERNKNIVSR